MKKTINDFINSIDTKLYSRLRGSMGDAECRRYLKEHLQKQLSIHDVIVCSNCKFNGMQPMNDSPCDMYNASEQTCSNYNKL